MILGLTGALVAFFIQWGLYEAVSRLILQTNGGTMEAANILYGVTMQEKGISKLLSLNIDEVNL